MSTVREEIMAQILGELNDNRPAGIPEFVNRRLLPESPVTDHTGSVYWSNEQVQPRGGSRHSPLVSRALKFVVEYRSVTSIAEEVDSIMEPMLAWGTKSLVKEKPLNGNALEMVEESTSWTPFFLEKYYPIVRQTLIVTFQTNKYDQEKVQ